MSDNKWHSGPPPSVGWWPASVVRCGLSCRWWDGKHWSKAAFQGESLTLVERAAKMKSRNQAVEWKHRPKSWPKRSFT